MPIDNDDLERVLRNLPVPEVRPAAYRETLLRVRAAQAESLAESGHEQRSDRFSLRGSRLKRLVAAGIALAIAVGGIWAVFSNPAAMAMSFGDVLRKVRQMSTVRYVLEIYDGDTQIERLQESVAGAGAQYRQASLTGQKSVVYDFAKKQCLVLTGDADATATLITDIKSTFDNPIDSLAKLSDTAGKACGTELLAGRQTEIFEAVSDQQVMRIWVDTQTELPVKVVISPILPKSIVSPPKTVFIINSIEWNCRFSDDTFALTLPPGYKWDYQRISESTPQDLVKMLSVWAQLADGCFPARLDKQAMAEFVGAKLEATGKGVPVDVGGSRSMAYMPEGGPTEKLILAARPGLRFVRKVADSDWCYQGAGIKLGDGASAICWWRDAPSSTYQVVYGDLTIKARSQQDLSNLRLPRNNAPPSP